MLTRVVLDGPLGKRFGREWNLAASTPNEAISLIEANEPGIAGWIRSNMQKYANYRVTVINHKGKKEKLNNETYGLSRDIPPREIRFTPIVKGAGAAARTIVGAVLIVVGYFFPPVAAFTVPMGISLMIGGLVELLSPRPKTDKGSSMESGQSYYFNGPVETTNQGVPVPLIYGLGVMVGSQPVSSSITIDQLM